MMSAAKVMEYDIDLVEIPFSLKKAGKVVLEGVLREVDGDGRDKYMEAIAARMKDDPASGKRVMRNFAAIASDILLPSMFVKDASGNLQPATLEQIQSLPNRVLEDFQTKSLEISGLDSKAEALAKKE